MSDQLFHYARDPVTLASCCYLQRPFVKPSGLWVSVQDAWEQWCARESFNVGALRIRHLVTLRPTANILQLTTWREIDYFTRRYACADFPLLKSLVIDWPAVAVSYPGIIIAPYCYARRLHPATKWYYGWNCASGCIWDLAAIKSLEVVP